MRHLIVEEQMRLELLQNAVFLHPAKKERLVDANPPRAQGGHHPLVGRRAPRRDDGRAHDRPVLGILLRPGDFPLLNLADLGQQPLQWSRVVRSSAGIGRITLGPDAR